MMNSYERSYLKACSVDGYNRDRKNELNSRRGLAIRKFGRVHEEPPTFWVAFRENGPFDKEF